MNSFEEQKIEGIKRKLYKGYSPCPVSRLLHGAPLYGMPDLVDEIVSSESELSGHGGVYFGQLETSDIISRPLNQPPLRSLYKFNENQINILSPRHMENGVVISFLYFN
jgi:hypothetical protein